MSLCIPTIVGPVSELSTSLRVQGALPGATIYVIAFDMATLHRFPTSRTVAKGKAVGGDDRLLLLRGAKLHASDILFARQESDSEKSNTLSNDKGLAVQPAPTTASELGYVGFFSRLYKCGEYLWIRGAVPGAQVEVEFSGEVKGSTTALEDGARLKLSQGLPDTEIISRQTIEAGKGPNTSGKPTLTPEGISHTDLHAPTIKQPILGCQNAILVTGVYDGATVTVQRDRATEKAGFDLSNLWFKLSTPLKEGEKVSVKQDLEFCQNRGVFSPAVVVSRPKDLTAPYIIPPLCSGSQSIRIGNLVPGSIVHINVNETIYKGIAPAGVSIHDFSIDPLPAEGSVKVVQELCGVTSPSSSAVNINPSEADIPAVHLLEPLYACGRVVFVENVHPGAMLQVWRTDPAGKKSPISAFIHIYDTKATIFVTPFLREKDKISVMQWACGGKAVESNSSLVLAHPTDKMPKIKEPVISGATNVVVENAIPGALIEIYKVETGGPVVLGAAYAEPKPQTTVYLTSALSAGVSLHVSQSICEGTNSSQTIVNVIRPKPQPPILDNPINGATGIARKPTLSWHDPGAGTDGRADSYDLQVMLGSTTIIPLTSLTTTSFTMPTDLAYSTGYTWQVRSKNPAGTSAFASSTFTVQKEPPPPPPILESYDVKTMTLRGRNFLPSHSVYVTVSVTPTNIYDSYGIPHSDNRVGLYPLKFNSDSSGNLSAVIDPQTALPPYPLDDIVGILYGVLPGEQLNFIANDERPGPHSGYLYSNILTITAP